VVDVCPARMSRYDWKKVRDLTPGGQGLVSEVAHVGDGRRGALKAYKGTKPSSEKSPVRRMRAAREVQTLELMQPTDGVPQVYEHNIGSPTEELYAVLEYIDGPTLGRWVEENGPMSAATCLEFAKVLGATLDQLHALDLVHRDLKPANVILRSAAPQTPVLLDLGLVGGKALDNVTSADEAMRNEFMIVPELASPHEPTRATDTAMFAGLIFFALTAQRPVQLRDGNGRMPHERIAVAAPGFNADQGRRLAILFSRAFQYAAATRFSSCSLLVEELMKIFEEPVYASDLGENLQKSLAELVTPKERSAVAMLRFRDLIIGAMGEYPRVDGKLLFADDGVSAHCGFYFSFGPNDRQMDLQICFQVVVKRPLVLDTAVATVFSVKFASEDDYSSVSLGEQGLSSPPGAVSAGADESGARLIADIVRSRAEQLTPVLLQEAILQAGARPVVT
jgi:serine/threonine protein kinase